ncbi:MAG TPA: GlxA family transcriptional regulator [Thermoleophilaceae bacterium]|jgi:transcriptional regulator GlxA family with amidase domain|nr:GlxA family transcriptional regulator [Thermoleophilaceae bacterium]
MRRVVIVAFPGVQTLDVTGPAEVLRAATKLSPPGYDVTVAAQTREPLATSTLSFVPDEALEDCTGPLDTLIVAGGTGTRAAESDERLIDWIRAAAGRSRRVASVCTGAFLLARAGLLDGRRATTHWASCAELARRYPSIAVEPDPIFVRDGHVATSAGVTAGMDLALSLVEEDLGREVALDAARWLVLFLKRPGGQAQFSAQLSAQLADRAPLRDLQAWIPDHLDADLSVPALARRASMSDRNFARAFRRETGMTPGAYVEAARVERARIALETGELPVEAVAGQVGFGTVETMRRAFRRRVGVSPVDYRSRFRTNQGAAGAEEAA